MRDRTADLNTASVALSQLSYSPKTCISILLLGSKEERILGLRPYSVNTLISLIQTVGISGVAFHLLSLYAVYDGCQAFQPSWREA